MQLIAELGREPISLETPVGSEHATLQDFVADIGALSPAAGLNAAELKRGMRSAMSLLSEREATILKLHFGLGDTDRRTLSEIGGIFGVTRERIRQIEDKALAKLRGRRGKQDLRPLFEA